MKTPYIRRLALSLCLSSLLWACTDSRQQSEEPASMDRAYASSSLEAHRNIRAELRTMVQQMPQLRDTMEFMMQLHPMMLFVDSILASLPTSEDWTARDTLMHSASDRLFNSYHELIHNDLKAVFLRYNQIEGEPEPRDRMYIDSVWSAVNSKDAQALSNYKMFLPQDSSLNFDLQPLIP